MIDRFAAAGLKIDRANVHIADLERIVLALPDAYASSVEIDKERGTNTLQYFSPKNADEIAFNMALIMGDAIHNLRTAIEYSYAGAVERHAPSVLDDYTKFPIGRSKESVENLLKSRKIDVLSQALFERLVSHIKPYEIGGNGFIKYLHDLDVRDKHWLLIPVLHVTWLKGVIVEDEQGHTEEGSTFPISGSGPYFFDFRPGQKIKDKGKISTDVLFGEGNPLEGLSILSTMKDFSKIGFASFNSCIASSSI